MQRYLVNTGREKGLYVKNNLLLWITFDYQIIKKNKIKGISNSKFEE